MRVSLCPSCGRVALADFAFCPYCGAVLHAGPGLAEASAVFDRMGQAWDAARSRRIEALLGELLELETDVETLLQCVDGVPDRL